MRNIFFVISIWSLFSFFETDVKSQSTAANVDGCGTGLENTYFGSLWTRYHISITNSQTAEGFGNHLAFVIYCFWLIQSQAASTCHQEYHSRTLKQTFSELVVNNSIYD